MHFIMLLIGLYIFKIILSIDKMPNLWYYFSIIEQKEKIFMEFYTSSKYKRPVRLSEKTRLFAYESLNHKYGLDTAKTSNVDMNHIKNYKELSPLERYNLGIYEIATKAPIRICDGEMISGAATLNDAKYHLFPAMHNDIERDYSTGVSHLTADFFEVLEIGMNGIRKKAERSLAQHSDPEKKGFIKSCLHCIDCMKIWHKRYIDELSKRPGYEKVIENLKQVPFSPARNFYEAVQSVWFCFAFIRLTGVWPGIGRIDVLLGEYLKNDLASRTLTLDEAREILAHFFIKGCEWIDGQQVISGDAQHYQNIVLSGIDENGNEVTNEVTYLVLDIVEETGIGDFPVTVRINKHTDEKFICRVAEVIRYGGGIVAVYNEDLILESLEEMGYPREEARRFANDGCWEIQIPGKTKFGYVPFDALKLLQKTTLSDYDGTASFENFDELLKKYIADIKNQVEAIFETSVLSIFKDDKFNFKPDNPCSVISLFEQSCIEKGLSYKEGGTVYTVVSPHIGGLPDAVNSLYAIKKAVFDDKIISFGEFMKTLENNWDGSEDLRKYILNDYTYFGNDNDEVDEIAAKILNDFSDACMEYDSKTSVRFVSGVSTFGRQLEWASARSAAPFGRKKGDVLSGNLSPTPGTDHSGAAAIIKSYCKADLRKQYTGAALDIGFVPSNIDSENAISALAGLIKGFVKLGGSFMQIDTVNSEVLIDAQKHPENYQTLSVRVSGWNARFVTMNKQWQDMIIDRTK